MNAGDRYRQLRRFVLKEEIRRLYMAVAKKCEGMGDELLKDVGEGKITEKASDMSYEIRAAAKGLHKLLDGLFDYESSLWKRADREEAEGKEAGEVCCGNCSKTTDSGVSFV